MHKEANETAEQNEEGIDSQELAEEIRQELDEFDSEGAYQEDESPVTGDGDTVTNEPPAAEVPQVNFAEELEKLKGEIAKKDRELGRLGKLTGDLHEELKTLRTRADSPSINNDNDEDLLDPETKETLSKVYLEARQKERENFFQDCERDLLETVERSDYDDSMRFFLEATKADKKLARRWYRSEDPAEFAYNEGKRIRETVKPSPDKVVLTQAELDEKIRQAKEEGTKKLKGLIDKGNGVIPSLSSVGAPGNLGNDKRSETQREIDDF